MCFRVVCFVFRDNEGGNSCLTVCVYNNIKNINVSDYMCLWGVFMSVDHVCVCVCVCVSACVCIMEQAAGSHGSFLLFGGCQAAKESVCVCVCVCGGVCVCV